jgi:uncharacterized protein
MIENNRGGILNVASTAAFQPGPNMACYYASKAYVLSLTEALWQELRGTNIKVSALCPGPTATEFFRGEKTPRVGRGLVGMMDADTVAKFGWNALMRGKRVAIPGWKNKLLRWLGYVSPGALLLKVMHFVNQPGRN